jgi:hypothetical protein
MMNVAGAMILAASLCGFAEATTILVGHDTQGPVTEHTKTGTYIQSWGVLDAATGSAVDEFGNVYINNPNFGNNQVEKFTSSGAYVSTMTATVDGQFIEDLGNFIPGFVLAGTYEGNVYRLSTLDMSHTLMFTTTDSFVGVTYDGTNIWTTGGFTTTLVYRRDLAGNILSSFDTGLNNGGIGWDPDDGTLWVGSFGPGGTGLVSHYTQAGGLLGSFDPGFSGFVDGLELRPGDVVVAPEPGTLALLLGGALGALAFRRR